MCTPVPGTGNLFIFKRPFKFLKKKKFFLPGINSIKY
jgi:hypothetical protein